MCFERPRPFREIKDQIPICEEEILKLRGFQGELKTWHDMSFVNFNTKSICSLPDSFYKENSNVQEYLNNETISEEMIEHAEDCIRLMAEDCDHLGDFDFFVDAASSFGSLVERVISDIIVDEYPKALRNTWAAFTNCNDLAFSSDKPSKALISLAITRLSEHSTRLIPILLNNSPGIHTLHEDELDMGQALNASVLIGAAMDTLATEKLLRNSVHSDSVLTDLGIATPSHHPHSEISFTSLSLGGSSVVDNWKSSRNIMRMNHTEETYASCAKQASDLPIYVPNFAYSGYSQQATSSVLLFDHFSPNLNSYIKSELLEPLTRANFPGESDTFVEVKESLCSMLDHE